MCCALAQTIRPLMCAADALAPGPNCLTPVHADVLQACLLAEVKERYPMVDVQFGVGCGGVDVSGDRPLLDLCATPAADSEAEVEEGCEPSTLIEPKHFDLVVGADGVRSAVRESLSNDSTRSTKTIRYPDNNERRYKTSVSRSWYRLRSKLGLPQ